MSYRKHITLSGAAGAGMRWLPLMLFAASVTVCLWLMSTPAEARRRINPVNTPATRTQNRNDARADSLRALERRRARSVHYHDENGNIVMVDTLTGTEWVDSTLLPKPPRMVYPLLNAVSVGLDIWDPVMRAFGQKYGLFGVWVNANLHNRYFPTFEFGLGCTDNTPEALNYTYKSSAAPFFRIGLDYNFFYNSNPDYTFTAGVRYGFSPFKFSVTDITLDDPYWGETSKFDLPSTSVTAGWFEFSLGLTVKLFGPVSAGWKIKYHSILHQSHPAGGDAWYIPGYGTQNSTLSGSFSIIYTLPLGGKFKSVKDLPGADTGTQPGIESGTQPGGEPGAETGAQPGATLPDSIGAPAHNHEIPSQISQ